MLTGNRKFIVVLVSIICSSVLIGVVLITKMPGPVGIIAAIAANFTAISIPFVTGNVMGKRMIEK